jgi:hypothetical protein
MLFFSPKHGTFNLWSTRDRRAPSRPGGLMLIDEADTGDASIQSR